jgi:hypothetical protein
MRAAAAGRLKLDFERSANACDILDAPVAWVGAHSLKKLGAAASHSAGQVSISSTKRVSQALVWWPSTTR